MFKVKFSLPTPAVNRWLEEKIEAREKDLYQRAMKLETCTKLLQEMEIWDNEFNQDGLEHSK